MFLALVCVMCGEIYDGRRLQVESVFNTAAWPAFLDKNVLGICPNDECNNTSIFSPELLQCFGVRSTLPVPDIPTPSLCYATLLFLFARLVPRYCTDVIHMLISSSTLVLPIYLIKGPVIGETAFPHFIHYLCSLHVVFDAWPRHHA
jgi:hypothetical protein